MTNATSAQGLALIQQYEGFRAAPTRRADGSWVVGYSHVRVGEPGEAVNENEAAQLLTIDVAPFEKLVNESVTRPLNQAQFDALVSFAFSVGAEAFEQSQVLRRVNAGDLVAAACAIDAWRKAEIGGESVVVDCLVRRRAAEKALFLRDMDSEAAPSAFMRAKLDYAASVLGAPVTYVPAPEVKDAPEPEPQVEPAQRLTEILKSEPATETLLLTQVVAHDVEDEDEIVTAHAKPVARSLEHVREATRIAFEAAEFSRGEKKRFSFFKRDPSGQSELSVPVDRRLRVLRAQEEHAPTQSALNLPSADTLALVVLLVFGFILIGFGASLMFEGEQDAVSIAGAAALVTPGLAAALMAVVGFWRSFPKRAAA